MGQPRPVGNDEPHIADLVVADIQDRKRAGVREYGAPLQPMNGRRALWDLYEELLDGAHYVRQRVLEEDKLLKAVTVDRAVRLELSDIYDRAERVRKTPGGVNTDSLGTVYVDDVAYLRMVIEAQTVALARAAEQTRQAELAARRIGDQLKTAVKRTPVGYQYRGREEGNNWVSYDESYQDEEYTSDRSNWSPGFYPEARPVYGGAWFRVDFDNPPVGGPESAGLPVATETPPDDESVSDTPPAPVGAIPLWAQSGG